MRAQESVQFSNQPNGANSTVRLSGGRYLIALMGTSASISFRSKEPDMSTNGRTMKDIHGNVVAITTTSTPALFYADCGAGQYDFFVTAGSATYYSATRVPLEE